MGFFSFLALDLPLSVYLSASLLHYLISIEISNYGNRWNSRKGNFQAEHCIDARQKRFELRSTRNEHVIE